MLSTRFVIFLRSASLVSGRSCFWNTISTNCLKLFAELRSFCVSLLQICLCASCWYICLRCCVISDSVHAGSAKFFFRS